MGAPLCFLRDLSALRVAAYVTFLMTVLTLTLTLTLTLALTLTYVTFLMTVHAKHI